MKTCRIKPSASECAMCSDTADLFGGTLIFGECPYAKKRYKLLGFMTGIVRSYGIVETDFGAKKS